MTDVNEDSAPISGGPPTPASIAARWIQEIELATKYFNEWEKRCEGVVARYRDDRSGVSDAVGFEAYQGQTKFNILWSNVQTLQPALYARSPKVVVERRQKDQDPIGRAAATILERATSYAQQCSPFDDVMRSVRDDYLLGGRGTAWIRYVPHLRDVTIPMPPNVPEVAIEGPQVSSNAEEEISQGPNMLQPGGIMPAKQPNTFPEVYYEEAIPDYVYWKDFLCSPARKWAEVRWVDRKSYLTREELTERFGEIMAKFGLDVKDVPLDWKPEMPNTDRDGDDTKFQMFRKARVHEIWDKVSRKVYWICPSYNKGPLDMREPPMRFRNFFPCPEPLFATMTNDSLIPVPDFCLYQDQAQELDNLTARTSDLSKVIRAVGVYDPAFPEIARMFEEGVENGMIPVNSWQEFATKGGLEGSVDYMPLETFVQALMQLYQARQQTKQDLYEITGISDIIRGESDPRETASAQNLKGQYASLRIKERQAQVQRFARDLLSLMAEVIAECFQPQTIALMANVEVESDQSVKAAFEQAIQLLRNDPMRTFRLDIETDSTIGPDEMEEKQAATEFVGAITQMITQMGPILAQAPFLGPFISELTMFLVRRYRAGRSLESALESALQAGMQQAQQPKPPSPDEEKTKAETAKIQAETQKTQAQIGQIQADTQRSGAETQEIAAKTGRTAVETERDQHNIKLSTAKLGLDAEKQRQEGAIRLAAIMKADTRPDYEVRP